MKASPMFYTFISPTISSSKRGKSGDSGSAGITLSKFFSISANFHTEGRHQRDQLLATWLPQQSRSSAFWRRQFISTARGTLHTVMKADLFKT